MPSRYATLQRVRAAIDSTMRDKLGLKLQSRALVFYYWLQLQEQILAVVPITISLVLTMAIYFQHSANEPGKLAGGLISAIFGLLLFMDGLRVAIMPLGDLIGHSLPEKFKVRYISSAVLHVDICSYFFEDIHRYAHVNIWEFQKKIFTPVKTPVNIWPRYLNRHWSIIFTDICQLYSQIFTDINIISVNIMT